MENISFCSIPWNGKVQEFDFSLVWTLQALIEMTFASNHENDRLEICFSGNIYKNILWFRYVKELRYRTCRYVATEWSIFLSFLACKTHKLWKFRFTMDPQYTQIFYRFNPLNKCHGKKLIRFLNTLSLTSIAFPYKSRIFCFFFAAQVSS